MYWLSAGSIHHAFIIEHIFYFVKGLPENGQPRRISFFPSLSPLRDDHSPGLRPKAGTIGSIGPYTPEESPDKQIRGGLISECSHCEATTRVVKILFLKILKV